MRVRKGAARKRQHKRVIRKARGQFGVRSKLFQHARQALWRGGVYADRDRRRR